VLVFAVLLANGPVLFLGGREPLSSLWVLAFGFPGNALSPPWDFSATFRFALEIIARPESFFTAGTVVMLPYSYLFRLVPMLRAFRNPVRILEVVSLSLSVLSGYGLKILLQSTAARFGKVAAALVIAVCGAIFTYELLPVPYPVTRWPVSPFFYRLASDPAEYAVVNVPLSDLEPMMMEPSIHHKAVFDGRLSRTPPNAYDFLKTNAFLQYCTLSSARAPAFPVYREKLTLGNLHLGLVQLRRVGARYIILHKQQCKNVPGTEEMLERRLHLETAWDDSDIRAYRIP
jgi:hypothetical protein